MQIKFKISNLFKNLIDLIYPKFCLNCKKEGEYLCEDCKSTLDILSIHQRHSSKNLKDIYFALPYQSPLIKKLVWKFKYNPFVKELSKPLSSLIIMHFQWIGNYPQFTNYILVPVPLEKKRLRKRGFNQAEEIGKELSRFLKIPLASNVLVKTKETPPQVGLSAEKRKINIRGCFEVKNKKIIKNRKILLVDDIYTTGSTMEECARILKMSGAKEIVGIAIAKAEPGDDSFKN